MSNDRYFLVIILGNLSHHVGTLLYIFVKLNFKKYSFGSKKRNNVSSESARLV